MTLNKHTTYIYSTLQVGMLYFVEDTKHWERDSIKFVMKKIYMLSH